MKFELTDQQRLVRRSARQLAEEHFAETAFTWEGSHPEENGQVLADHDMLSVSLPEEYGGAGMAPMDTIMAMEGVGAVCPDSANLIRRASFGPPLVVAKYGTDEQKERYLPSLAAGETYMTIAMSEPEAGSHTTNLSTSAEADGDDYIVNGRKAWVSAATVADTFLTYVRMPDGYIGSMLIDRDTSGLTVGEPDANMANHPQSEIFFDDVRVPSDQILLTGKDAFKRQITAYNLQRIGACALVWTCARWAFEEALRYAQERIQFDRPIAEFQAIQHRLSDMAIGLDTSRLLIYRAVADGELPTRIESSMAKVHVVESCHRVIDDALQIKGAAGYVGDTPESYLYRFVRGFKIGGGTSNIHRDMIAKSLYEDEFPEF